MKIVWVSSWPPRPCGIATYSSELVEAMRDIGHSVEIVCHTDGGNPGEKEVHSVINLDSLNWPDVLLQTISQIKTDVIHIQHEFGLYRRDEDFASGLFEPLFQLRLRKNIPIIITYHSVYTKLKPYHALYIDIVQKIVDIGIVHELCQYKNLPLNLGHALDNIRVISHGARRVPHYSKAKAKEKIGVEANKKVIGLLGWFTPTKGFERVLNNWDYLVEKVGPSLQLVLGGSVREGLKVQEKYKNKLVDIINSSKYKNQVKVILNIPSQEQYLDVIRSFDMMVLPYTFASQSGNLAHAFACGIPVVVSGIEGLKEEVEKSGAGIVVSPVKEEELIENIVVLIENEPLRNKFSRKGRKYVENKINWSIIAQKHIDLYKKLLDRKKG